MSFNHMFSKAKTIRILLIICISSIALTSVFCPIGSAQTNRFNPPIATRETIRDLLLRPFDKPEHNWLPGHRGVDFSIEPGQPIHAPADGTVHFRGSVAHTPTLSLMHDGDIRTTYQPIVSDLRVGTKVIQGQVIGIAVDRLTLPETQHPEPGLHFGAVRSKEYMDPMRLLFPHTIRLYRIEETTL